MTFAGAAAVAVTAASALCLSGCTTLGYYWQSVAGHVELMSEARPVRDWLDDSG
jgi:predicted aminopeptidase